MEAALGLDVEILNPYSLSMEADTSIRKGQNVI